MWIRTLNFVLVQKDLGQVRPPSELVAGIAHCNGRESSSGASLEIRCHISGAVRAGLRMNATPRPLPAHQPPNVRPGPAPAPRPAVCSRDAEHGQGPGLLQHRLGDPHPGLQAPARARRARPWLATSGAAAPPRPSQTGRPGVHDWARIREGCLCGPGLNGKFCLAVCGTGRACSGLSYCAGMSSLETRLLAAASTGDKTVSVAIEEVSNPSSTTAVVIHRPGARPSKSSPL